MTLRFVAQSDLRILDPIGTTTCITPIMVMFYRRGSPLMQSLRLTHRTKGYSLPADHE